MKKLWQQCLTNLKPCKLARCRLLPVLMLAGLATISSAGGYDESTLADKKPADTVSKLPPNSSIYQEQLHPDHSYQALTALLAPMVSLQADFQQIIVDAEGYEIQSTSGTMTVAKPGKIHWQTNPPFEQLLVADASTLWLYDQDLEQVTVRPFDDDIANTPAVLFMGNTEGLSKKYVVSSKVFESKQYFTLIPVTATSMYQQVRLIFSGETPVSMTLWDSLGQTTKIDFEQIILNEPVDENLFHFEIPDGVDVLYDQQ